MFLRSLVPLALLFVVLPIVVQGTRLRHYGGKWTREVPALLFCSVLYFGIWTGVWALVRAVTGWEPPALVIASLVALLSLRPGLGLGFKIFGVHPPAPSPGGVH